MKEEKRQWHAYLQRKRVRFALVWATYAVLFTVSGVIAFFLRFDFSLDREQQGNLLIALGCWLPANIVSFRFLHVDKTMRRFASLPDVRRMAIAVLSAACVSTVVIEAIVPGFPRSVHTLQFVVNLLLNCGVCVAARTYRERSLELTGGRGKKGQLAVIYGAGVAGQKLARELRDNPQLGYDVVGYLDDDPLKAKAWVNGAPVIGIGTMLPQLAKKHKIATVLIAMPSADRHEMNRILNQCEEAHLPCKTIPSVSEIVEGRGLAYQMREVAVEDLLGRTPIRLEESEIAANISARVVLVTGAAGSIGSELCRQIARFTPSVLVVFDIAESGLFYLELEMAQKFPQMVLNTEVGNVCDVGRVQEIFSKYKPAIVFHAAAYKHVPLMERHVFSAIENNVLGSANVASIAETFAATKFVMISTDKAVHPTSVMGLSKRIAELVINSMHGKTQFLSVRFGNVLDSCGSVVPIFKKQIAAGGPVTVTHPEMRRYFMTIPEASQLVLQAASMGKGGEIFILEMGEPVLISDLARKLIRLSGLQPDLDIKLTYTGIRPGEKLSEELTGDGEDHLPTYHEKIRAYQGVRYNSGEMNAYLERVREACEARNTRDLMSVLQELVPEYQSARNPASNQDQQDTGYRNGTDQYAAMTAGAN